jgi:hypothetical protein
MIMIMDKKTQRSPNGPSTTGTPCGKDRENLPPKK